MRLQAETSSEQLLIQSLREDDWGAFEIIYSTYWSKMYLSAYSLLRDKQACEDIIQDIFMQLWTRRAELHIESLKAYLHTAVRYQVFRLHKSGKLTDTLPEEIHLSTGRTDVEDALDAADLNAVLDTHIARLPERCREVFLLSRRSHLSIREISERLQISSKTVENHLSNALARLRSDLGDTLFWLVVMLPEIWK